MRRKGIQNEPENNPISEEEIKSGLNTTRKWLIAEQKAKTVQKLKESEQNAESRKEAIIAGKEKLSILSLQEAILKGKPIGKNWSRTSYKVDKQFKEWKKGKRK